MQYSQIVGSRTVSRDPGAVSSGLRDVSQKSVEFLDLTFCFVEVRLRIAINLLCESFEEVRPPRFAKEDVVVFQNDQF